MSTVLGPRSRSAGPSPASPRPAAGPGVGDPPTPWGRVAGLVLAVTAAVALLLVAFAWPAAETRPRDLAVAVVAPPAAVERLQGALDSAQPGAFALRPARDAAEAEALVRDREVAGAVVLRPDGPPQAVVATQAGPALAQVVTGLAQAAAGAPTPVLDVAPAPEGDPRGIALPAAVLPLALGGVAASALLAVEVRGTVRRLVGAVGVALLAGPVVVALLHGWLGALSGDGLAESVVVGLGVLATALALLGLHAVAGRAGLGLGALTVVALGNPLSAAATSPLLLPDGWSGLGQALPPGAVVAALRAVSGFDGAGAAGPLAVLGVWALAGLVLLVAGASRRRPR